MERIKLFVALMIAQQRRKLLGSLLPRQQVPSGKQEVQGKRPFFYLSAVGGNSFVNLLEKLTDKRLEAPA